MIVEIPTIVVVVVVVVFVVVVFVVVVVVVVVVIKSGLGPRESMIIYNLNRMIRIVLLRIRKSQLILMLTNNPPLITKSSWTWIDRVLSPGIGYY